MFNENAAGVASIGGGYENANCDSHFQNTTNGGGKQAPSGHIPAEIENGLISIGGRNVARVSGGALRRTLDLQRETMRGAIWFRDDVLALARKAGATRLLCTDRSSGDAYTVGMAVFLRDGWAYVHQVYGAQRGLPLTRWQRASNGPAGAPVQLALFVGVQDGK